jgi:hypothetical protein
VAEQVFSDRYKIVRHLARGGMAEVYVAHDLLLDRPVALKVLFPEFSANHSFVERFRREARAAANLNHPNIVSVYDWGEEGRTYFIVMEYIEGSTIRELILKHRRLSPKQAAAVGAEIASALAFAHNNGVIHRDVKPGNVIISDAGHVKVMDFGIARAGDPQDSLTQTGAVMGTATYFSPEQAQGKPLDGRSDLYSLGVVLYEVVAGVPPFTGENPVSIAYQHVREEPVPLRERDPRISEAFEAIVMKAMAKNLDHRYADAEELRADLLRFREGKAVEAERTVVGSAAAVDATAAMAATRVGTAVDGTQVLSPTAAQAVVGAAPRRAGAYIALLVILLGALGLLLVLLARSLGVTGGGSQVTVPTTLGKSRADAVTAIENAGLKADVREAPSGTVDLDKVFSQDPTGGARLKKGTKVILMVSSGPPSGTVPSVIGQSYQSASDELVKAGFRVTKNAPIFDANAPPDQVVDQTPDAGSQLQRGGLVRLTTSKGPQPTTTASTAPPTTEPPPPPTFPPIFTPTTEPPTTPPRRTTTTTEP